VADGGRGVAGRRETASRRGLAAKGDGLAHEKLGAVAGHEHAGRYGYPQAAEFRPAHDLFERPARDALFQHDIEFGRGTRRGAEQPRLVLRKDTARGPEPGDDGGLRAR
jgi:hypothetical protein